MKLPKLNREARRKLLHDAKLRNEVARAKKAFERQEKERECKDVAAREALRSE